MANSVRREISQPLSAERLIHLRKTVGNSLQTIDGLLIEAGTTPDALPIPSRKAHQFLKGIDFDIISTRQVFLSTQRPPGSVTFRGLRSYLDDLLDQLGQNDSETAAQKAYESICSSNENIERQIQADDIRPEQLKPQSRDIRGWLAFFSQQANFNVYLSAVRLAYPIFKDALGKTGKWAIAPILHFRPMKGVYRLRGCGDRTFIHLPTPMISFEKEILQNLALLTVRQSRNKQPVHDAMLSVPYQEILAEIDLLSGMIEQAAGIHHDLAASFDRVNNTYFQNGITRPRLAWSQTFTSRKFGHYDRMHDTVMVSASLDRSDVPELVVDFIMYHELLHKKLGVVWNNGRQSIHTQDFQQEERRFARYDEARGFLKKLAGDSYENHLSNCDKKPPKQTALRTGYADIETPGMKPLSHIGRNAPCPCGSGRKYKKCCGR